MLSELRQYKRGLVAMAQCFDLMHNGQLIESTSTAVACQGYVMLDAVDYANWQTGLTNWSYDNAIMLVGFGGAVLCWSAGLAVGLVISIVRKSRTL